MLSFTPQKLIIDSETAPLVLEIFERYSEGSTMCSIIGDFNSRGLTTKRGKPFKTNSFNALLKKRKYIGEYSYQDVVVPGGVPTIVLEDLFYRVQQRMEKNKRVPAMAKAARATPERCTIITSAATPSVRKAATKRRSKKIGSSVPSSV